MVALYVRVSTQEQAANGHSIEEQTERLKSYCKAMGWQSFRIYTDGGFSGGNTDRPALKKLLQDIHEGKVSKIAVYKLDRLSRSQLDTLYLIEKEFIGNGVDFVSISENFDTASPFGRAMIGLLAVFAQLEREQIKERMEMGKVARAKKGRFAGTGIAPIGYDYKNGELVVNDFEALQVRKVFELYASGLPAYSIAKRMNEEGYHHKNGKWLRATVQNIISKRTYIGDVSYGKEWYEGTHEPIISEELFEAANRIRDQRREDFLDNHKRGGQAASYLGGLLYCARCGRKFFRHLNYGRKDGKVVRIYSLYKCNGRKQSLGCHNKNWTEDILDKIIFGEIRKLATDPDSIRQRIRKEEKDDSKAIRKELQTIDDKIARLMDLYSEEEMPKEILRDRITELSDQRKKLEASIEPPKKAQASEQEIIETASSFSSILDGGDFEEIRAALTALIEKIELDGEDIKIFWRF